MTEEKQPLFQVETIFDFPVWKALCLNASFVTPKNRTTTLLSILLAFILGIYLFFRPHFAMFVPIGFIIGYSPFLIRKFRNRKDPYGYRKMLKEEGGKPPHMVCRFTEEGIQRYHVHKDTTALIYYHQITDIYDGGDLLLLMLDTQKVLPIDPLWIQGGTKDDLLSFLNQRCVNIKKGVQKLTFWKKLGTIRRVLTILILIGAVILSAFRLLSPAGTSSGNLSYREAAAVLEELDIHCSEESIRDAEVWEAEYQALLEEFSAELGYMPEYVSTEDRILSLLCNAGYGSYDYDTWQWTPPDSGVYWLDMEAMDVSSMYTQYLRGVAAISGGTLVITNIAENHDGVDFEEGTGDIQFSFTLNGANHQLTIPMDYDWYDAHSLDEINQRIGSAEGRRIYVASDRGQGVLIFFRSSSWAGEFEKNTGIPLLEKISRLWYGYPY